LDESIAKISDVFRAGLLDRRVAGVVQDDHDTNHHAVT
jgi:hypothetical protein